ncbi:MAG: OmpA family protein [Verrucomicrobiales bacterium]
MNRGISIALLAVLFYGILLSAAVVSSRSRIEADLTQRAEDALKGIDDLPPGIALSVDGRDALIEGEIHDNGQGQHVLKALSAVKGVRVVESRLSVKPPEHSRLVIEQVDDGWMLDGQVAHSEVAAGLEQALRGALKPGEKLQGRMRVEEHTRPSAWQEPLGRWFGQYLAMVSGNWRLEILENKLHIFGEVFNKQTQEHVLANARSHFSGSGLEIIDEIAVITAPDPPELTITQGEDGGFMITGKVRELAFKERLVELIREGSDGENVSEQLSIGEHISPASWETPLTRLLPALITEVEELHLHVLGPAHVSINDIFINPSDSLSVLTMSGTVLGNEKKQAIDELAAQVFRGITIDVDNQLSIFVAPDPASFVISRGDDGVLRLGGLLPNTALADGLLAAASNVLETDQPPLLNEIKTGENVSEALWVDAMVSLIKPFIHNVQWGALSVHEDSGEEYPQVALEATVSDPASGDVLQALVEHAFPTPDEAVAPDEQPRYKRVIALSLAKPPGPSDEDIAALEKAVAETVVYFESTSSRINPEEHVKLSVLAERFAKVPGASLALLGYTDPYGNALYNRELSGKRCKAVRDALEELGIAFILLEIEQKGETTKSKDGRVYESGRRVEFELR